MKFIHFADAHLDSPFRGLSFLPSNEFSQIYQAADQSLTRIVDLAIQEDVDLVLIAGDTFDSSHPSPRSQLFFAQQIKKLTDQQIQVVMIFGNHDHMEQENLLVNPSPYFKLLGNQEKIERVSFETKTGFAYDVVGFSYLNNHITKDMIPAFPNKSQNYTFGLMHAQAKSSTQSQNVYAPFTIREMQELNYNYFALGHIHARQNLSTSPWIVYPGNIQGRHVNELGAKGCYLGQIDEKTGQTTIEFHATDSIIWQEKKLKLAIPTSKVGLQEKIITSLSQVRQKTYFSLNIQGAQFLTQEEQDLVQDSDFWQSISLNLPLASQLVDVRYTLNSQLQLNANDQEAFVDAEAEIFASHEFSQIAQDWQKKNKLTSSLAEDPHFLQLVKQLTEVKIMSELKGLNDEAETD